jgi:hypothetical protein
MAEMITESKIKAALRAATTADKPRLELRDGGMRGAGRLVLIIRGNGDAEAPTSEFYACWYRDGHRRMLKLGSYPTISLAEARKRLSRRIRARYLRRRRARQRRRPATA